MTSFVDLVPILNFGLNLFIIPMVYWIFQIERRISRIEGYLNAKRDKE